MSLNGNAIGEQTAESFAEHALHQICMMDDPDEAEDFGRPVSIHDICANMDVSRPTESGNMGRRASHLDSEGEDDEFDDEDEVLINSIQLDMSDLTTTENNSMSVIEEEEVITSIDIDRRVSMPHFGASENLGGGFSLSRPASDSGFGRSNSMQKFMDMFSWKRRTKSETHGPGGLANLQEEDSKPEPDKNERKGLFGRRKKQNRNNARQSEAQPPRSLTSERTSGVTGGEAAPLMNQKLFQSFFHNAVEGRVEQEATGQEETIDFSTYIL